MEGIIMRPAQLVSLLAIKFAFCLILCGCGESAPTPPTASMESPRGELPTGPKKEAFDDARPAVQIRTSLGEITVELDQENAPITVGNFLGYVGRGQYDGTIFHQVVGGYMALGGGYDAALKERKVGIPILNEAHHGMKNVRGTIAMARIPEVVNSATNQFFFNLADNPHLDHQKRTPEGYGYCAFGKVTAGLDILEKIGAATVADQPDFPQIPTPPVVIESIQRVR